MKILKYLNPKNVFNSLQGMIEEKIRYNKYVSILDELVEEKKLEAIGLSLTKNKMYVGVNLNPELLLYTDESQETVELKFVAEKVKKYTDFLQAEGILDVVIASYDRVYNEDFYGYIVQIAFNYEKYNGKRLIYDIIYTIIALGGVGVGIYSLLKMFI